MEIKPIKSLRAQMHAEGLASQQAERSLELARKLMQQACAQETLSPDLLKKALDLYAKAIDQAPNKAEPYLAIAYISQQLGDLRTAAHFLKTLLILNPMSVRAQSFYLEIEAEAQAQAQEQAQVQAQAQRLDQAEQGI